MKPILQIEENDKFVERTISPKTYHFFPECLILNVREMERQLKEEINIKNKYCVVREGTTSCGCKFMISSDDIVKYCPFCGKERIL